MGTYVMVNVGSMPHTTARDTLLREPASRLALLVRGVLPAQAAPDGSLFLDRSPKHFQSILNFLRDGWAVLPKLADERRELMAEIRYYQLSGMEAWLRAQDAASPPLDAPCAAGGIPPPAAAAAALGALGAAPSARYDAALLASLPRPSPFAGYCGSPPPSAASSPLSTVCRAAGAGAAAGFTSGTFGSYAGSAAADVLASGLYAGSFGTMGAMSGAGGGGGGASPLGASGRSSMWAGAPPPLPGDLAAGAAAAATAGAAARSSAMFAGGAAVPGSSSLYRPASPTLPRAASIAAAHAATYHDALSPQQAVADGPLSPRSYVPQPADPAGGFRWTSKYLATNERARAVVGVLLELAYLAPHAALHAGQVTITIASECTHDRMSALLGAQSGDCLRDRLQVVSVKSSSGWAFELALRPGGDPAVFDKFSVAEYVQDNWFVLSAVLKDEYNILIEEDTGGRPPCAVCRRATVSFTVERRY